MNSVALIGRLTRDVELRHTPGGTEVASFAIAVDRAGQRQEDGSFGAGFFEIVAWGKTAEVCARYLGKGKQVGVEGELRFEKWQTQDGSNRSAVKVNCRHITFCGSRDETGGSSNQFVPVVGNAADAADMTAAYADDDIPF